MAVAAAAEVVVSIRVRGKEREQNLVPLFVLVG